MVNKPTVSVIIPSYNREAFVSESIESVLKQTYTDWEIIIIDDASTDKTGEMVRVYTKGDPRIKYFRNERNLGIAKTRNKGLDLAQGRFIAPLDSDDVWLDENKLKNQVEFLEVNHDYVLIGGGIMYIDKDSKPIRKMLFPIYDSVIRNIILQYNPFPHSTVLYRRNAAQKCGGYPEEYTICEDYELWLKLGLKHKFTNFPKVLTGYRIHGGNITYKKRLTAAANTLAIVKKYKKHYKRSYIGIIKAYLRILASYFRS